MKHKVKTDYGSMVNLQSNMVTEDGTVNGKPELELIIGKYTIYLTMSQINDLVVMYNTAQSEYEMLMQELEHEE